MKNDRHSKDKNLRRIQKTIEELRKEMVRDLDKKDQMQMRQEKEQQDILNRIKKSQLRSLEKIKTPDRMDRALSIKNPDYIATQQLRRRSPQQMRESRISHVSDEYLPIQQARRNDLKSPRMRLSPIARPKKGAKRSPVRIPSKHYSELQPEIDTRFPGLKQMSFDAQDRALHATKRMDKTEDEYLPVFQQQGGFLGRKQYNPSPIGKRAAIQPKKREFSISPDIKIPKRVAPLPTISPQRTLAKPSNISPKRRRELMQKLSLSPGN